jgi:hypothetical protein
VGSSLTLLQEIPTTKTKNGRNFDDLSEFYQFFRRSFVVVFERFGANLGCQFGGANEKK